MKNYLLLGFLTLAASFTPIFAKLTVSEISPVSLGFLRFGTATVLFYITLRIRKQNLIFERKDYPKLIILGLLCIPLNQYFFLTGVKMSFASHSGILYSLNPVIAYLVAIMKKNEKFYVSKIIAISLTVIGIFFVFYEALTKTTPGDNILWGDFLLIFAVISFSLYISLGKEFIDRYGPLKVTTLVFIAGSILNIPFFISDLPNLTFSDLSISGIIGFFYLAIVISFFAYFIWYYSLKTIQISMLTTVSNLSPLLTVLFSIIFLSEKISFFFIIGGFITIIGVLIMQRVSIEFN
ncbi:MAG: DMT family transporter [Ignavibacteria bacterium]